MARPEGNFKPAHELAAHVADACKHMFYLGAIFFDTLIAQLLAFAQWLVLLALALNVIFEAQGLEHL